MQLKHISREYKEAKIIANLIKYQPENISLYLEKNGQTLFDYGTKNKLHLASIVKIIIALEFIQQVEKGLLNENMTVSIKELDSFYIPYSDGGGHEKWKKTLNSEPKLIDVCHGMIRYSSNANTEYLMNLLSFFNVNDLLNKLGIKEHDFIYPFSSAGLIPGYYIKEKKLSVRATRKKIYNISDEDYINLSFNIFNQIKKDEIDVIEKYNILRSYDKKIQMAESKKFIKGRLIDYINIFYKVLEYPKMKELFRSPLRDNSIFNYVAYKGGSTVSINNSLMYLEDKDDNTYMIGLIINEKKRGGSRNGFLTFQKNLVCDLSYQNAFIEMLR